jgi:hypothetical protein
MGDFPSGSSNLAVAAVTGVAGFLSLHTADPGTTGANEVTGGSYVRQAITWNAASGGEQTSSDGQTFPNMPSVAGNLWIGLWGASTSGTFYWGDPTAAVTGPVVAGNSVVFLSSAVTAGPII